MKIPRDNLSFIEIGEMKIKNSQFYFRLRFTGKCKEEITIFLEGKYKKDSNGRIQINNRSRLDFKNKSYCGSITLNPSFYILPEIRKKVMQEKKQDSYFAKPVYQNKPSPSKYTNYRGNNVAKPYQGGTVTPK